MNLSIKTSPPSSLLFNKLGFDWIYSIVCGLFILGLFWLTHWTTFTEDDAHLIKQALIHDWISPYIQPEIYQELSAAHYTPVLHSVYKAIVSINGADPMVFLIAKLCSLSVLTALACLLSIRLSGTNWAAALTLLLILSNGSLISLTARFYTIHYVVGGIFVLLCLLIFFRSRHQSPVALSLFFITLVLSLLSKELYLVVPPLFFIISVYLRRYHYAGISLLALVIYLVLRHYILGGSVQGRSGENHLMVLTSLDFEVWKSFGLWFMQHRSILLIALLIALILQPKKMLVGLLCSLSLALPALAAPHSLTYPDLHADRVFFGFDIAIAIAIASVIAYQFGQFHCKRAFFGIALLLIATNLYISSERLRAAELENPNVRVTRYILKLSEPDKPHLILAPLGYDHSEIGNVLRLTKGTEISVTADCRLWLRSGTDKSAFDRHGSQLSYNSVAKSCLPASPEIAIIQPVQFDHGILSWEFSPEEPFAGGVFFIERGLSVPLTRFSQRLARPFPGEQYQWFAFSENQWWFSKPKTIRIIDSSISSEI